MGSMCSVIIIYTTTAEHVLENYQEYFLREAQLARA